MQVDSVQPCWAGMPPWSVSVTDVMPTETNCLMSYCGNANQ